MTALRPALLVTRPLDAAKDFVRAVQTQVVTGPVVISPVMEIVGNDQPVDLNNVGAVIYSSANAVAAYCGPCGGVAFCVGPKTTKAAFERGFDSRLAGKDADGLVAYILANPPSGALLHLRGTHTRGDIAKRLSERGLSITETIIYDQRPRPLSPEAKELLDGERAVILPLFSPRSAALLSTQRLGQAPKWVVALSPAVADAAAQMRPERLIVAKHPDGAAMCAAVARLYDDTRPVEGRKANA